ncbi:MAG: DUF4432 family protein [Lapillicoccus sp.]
MSPPDPRQTSTPDRHGAARLVADGLVGHADQVAVARASVSGADRGQPQRALDLDVLGGLSLRLRPDRGLDVGAVWWRGTPLAWSSRVGEVAGRPTDAPQDWIRAFGGGLVTTCGLQNVGRPVEGYGQHGAFSSTPASEVTVTRTVVGDELELVVTGLVEEVDALDTFVECRRTVTTRTGPVRLTVTDVVTNRGAVEVAAPMLYHVNLGAPVWSPGARLEVPGRADTVPRDDDARAALADWTAAPAPEPGGRERVFEHLFDAAVDDVSERRVRVVNPDLGVAVTVAWDASTLPRLHQWVHPRSGVYVLGIEPANCSVLGRAADREAGRLPVLAAGASRTTSLTITAEDLAPTQESA